MATDLEYAVAALTTKKPVYDAFWKYYEGNAPLVYNTARLREIFKNLDARFTQNWAAVVVDSVLDRMELRTPTVTDQPADTDELAQAWEAAGITDDEYSVHEDLCVTGEAYIVGQVNAQGQKEAFYNDARLCHLFYEPSNPRRKWFGCKWWQEADETLRLTLYYADRFEYYRTLQRVNVGDIVQASSFVPDELPAAANPEPGIIPVFHYRSTPRGPKSQLQNVVETQDAINKLLADMMVAAEFGAFQQRWAITNANLEGVKARPDTIVRIPPADVGEQPVSVGEFSTTDLRNYLDSISQLSTAIGIITRTPKHYFYAQGGDPSGEALIALEAPLTRKVERLQATLKPVWRELGQWLLGRVDAPVYVAYEAVETVQPMTEATILATQVTAGLPVATALKEQGWTDADIEEVQADALLLPLPGPAMKAQREAYLMDQQMGIASAETLAGKLGYAWEEEQARRSTEAVNTGDQVLSAFDRGEEDVNAQ